MEHIKIKIINAYKSLLKNDSYLLATDVNERSITHKLAEYLQVEFSEYNVDCEYNRNGLDVKGLESLVKNIASDNTDVVSVFPDIIIHHRGSNDNFIVIEAKKSSNKSNDNEKLVAYKRDLKYQNAYAVKFFVGDDFVNYKKVNLNDLISEK